MVVDIILFVLAGLLIAGGILGLALPVLPGAPMLFVGFLIVAWTEDFEYIGWGSLVVLGIMSLLLYVVDFVASAFGAKRFGASGRSAIGATIGAFVGIFFGIIGIVVGPFIGAVIGELSLRRDLAAAGQAGIGATVGLALGVAAKVAVAFSMIGYFIVIRFL